MKQTTKTIIGAVALVVFIAVAAFVYDYLSNDYGNNTASGITTSDTLQQTVKANTAEDFTVVDKDDNKVTLSSHFGKPIIVNFWASWCGPCISEMSYFEQAYAENGSEIEFMMVNLTDGYRDTKNGVSQFVAEKGYTFPVYFDIYSQGANAYDVYSIPQTVIIGKDGNVLKSHIGRVSQQTLNQYIALAKGENQ